MKVKELIELLKKCNPEATISCHYWDKNDPSYEEQESFEPLHVENFEDEVWIRE